MAAFFARRPVLEADGRARTRAVWARVDGLGEHVDAQETLAMLILAGLANAPPRAAGALARLTARRSAPKASVSDDELVFLCVAEAQKSLAMGWTKMARNLAEVVESWHPQTAFAQGAAAAVLEQTGDVARASAIARRIRQRRDAAAGWGAASVELAVGTVGGDGAVARHAKREREDDDRPATRVLRPRGEGAVAGRPLRDAEVAAPRPRLDEGAWQATVRGQDALVPFRVGDSPRAAAPSTLARLPLATPIFAASGQIGPGCIAGDPALFDHVIRFARPGGRLPRGPTPEHPGLAAVASSPAGQELGRALHFHPYEQRVRREGTVTAHCAHAAALAAESSLELAAEAMEEARRHLSRGLDVPASFVDDEGLCGAREEAGRALPKSSTRRKVRPGRARIQAQGPGISR